MRLSYVFFVYLLLIFSTFTSCKSSKHIGQTTDSSEVRIRSADSVQLDLNAKDEQHRLMNELINEGWNFNVTVFTPPDSTGRQYVRSRGEFSKNRKVRHQEQLVRNKSETTQATAQQKKDKATSREVRDKQENFKFTERPNFVRPVFLLAALGFILIYIIKKWLH